MDDPGEDVKPVEFEQYVGVTFFSLESVAVLAVVKLSVWDQREETL